MNEQKNDNETINLSNDGNENNANDSSGVDSEDISADSSKNSGKQQHAIKQNIKSGSTWLRLFFMLVIIFLYGVTRAVLGAVVFVQFFWVLFTGQSNQPLKQLGQQLATYTYQIIRYLSFNTEDRPFPFDLDWPKEQ